MFHVVSPLYDNDDFPFYDMNVAPGSVVRFLFILLPEQRFYFVNEKTRIHASLFSGRMQTCIN